MRWSIAFVTMDRPDAAQRFVRSARRLFPDVPIYVADQSAALAAMREFYEAERVTLVRMPFDAGLSASRNALVEAMDVDYFALCDDDFVLGPSSSFESAIEVLEADRGLGVVGGMLHDLDQAGERIRNWEVFFDHDERHGRFTVTPIYNYPPLVRRAAGRTLFACDAVLNFAVFRMAMFADGLRWDHRIEIERRARGLLPGPQDALARTEWPTSRPWRRCTSPSRGTAGMRHCGRGARDATPSCGQWGVTAHVEIGTGGRPLDGAPVEDWFVAGEGTARRPPASPTRGSTPPSGRSPRGDEPRGPNIRASWAWLARDAPASPSLVPGRSVFRYQPAVNPDGDLLLWYRPAEAPRRSRRAGRVAHRPPVVLPGRRRARVGERRACRARRRSIDTGSQIVARIPLWPRGATHLRFDVVCAGGTYAPLAMGFVFPEREAAGWPESAGGAGGAGVGSYHTGRERRGSPARAAGDAARRSAAGSPFEAVRHGRQPW